MADPKSESVIPLIFDLSRMEAMRREWGSSIDRMPPLRDRKADVLPLARHFVQKYGAKLGKRIEVVPKKLMNALQAYRWPGNVRELENIIERCVILSQGNRICIDEFFDLNPKFKSGNKQRPITLREVERTHILQVLEETGWVIEGKYGAATRMDIHPATLRSRMKKLGIKRPRQKKIRNYFHRSRTIGTH